MMKTKKIYPSKKKKTTEKKKKKKIHVNNIKMILKPIKNVKMEVIMKMIKMIINKIMLVLIMEVISVPPLENTLSKKLFLDSKNP
jgi:hypothetical protein